nr:reverse transcriptase domain-containing protein [Tanacetum cinerariifolium]
TRYAVLGKVNIAYRAGFLGLDTAYESRVIRRIGNWSNVLSCEVQALIRRISFAGYGVLVRNQQSSNVFILVSKYKAFHRQIRRNLEVFVDELVIKSRTENEIIRGIEETFITLREINKKLNPKKRTFEMKEGMFLGYKVNTKGIKVCPDKVEAILSFPSLKCLKDVQKLNGKLASLNRFMSKSAKKSLPFFETLKKCTKKSDFQWTMEAEAAFRQMKNQIAEVPTLTTPTKIEELTVYLMAAEEAVRTVLMTKREGKQMPIYFVSRALQGPEINYKPIENLVLALSIEVGEYGIHYRPRISVKGQILADFIVELQEDDSLKTPIEVEEKLPDPWTLFTDGSSCVDGFGAELVLINSEGMEFTYALRFRFDATNNDVEYESLIAGLMIAKQIGVLAVVEEESSSWMTPIYEYLMEETLPAKKKKARAVRRKSRRKDWIEEIPHVLWAHRTMIKSSNEDTPFSLTYEIEAVIPAEIGMRTLRTAEIDMVQNDEALEINLDLLEEIRDKHQSMKQKARQRWKNIATPKSATQASNQETLCTGTMMPAIQKIAKSLALSGKDRTKQQKH